MFMFGDEGVGKTSLLGSLLSGQPTYASASTEGVNTYQWQPFKHSSYGTDYARCCYDLMQLGFLKQKFVREPFLHSAFICKFPKNDPCCVIL